MAGMNSDVVRCPSSGEQTLDVRSTVDSRSYLISIFYHLAALARDSVLMNIDCMCWTGKNGIFLHHIFHYKK